VELTREILQKRYSRFSNEALLAAKAAGPGPYSPLAWEVIQALVAARGLEDRAAEAAAKPAAPAPAPGPKPAPAPAPPAAPAAPSASPYFIASRSLGQRWPADVSLPLTGRYILGVAALVFGIAGGVLVILAFVHRGGAAVFDPGVLKLAAASALSLAFSDSSRRPPSAKHWWFALLYSAVLPPLALGQMGTITTAPVLLIALEIVVALLWLLYFARRRAAYGLKPWWWLN
jgi:hypothetical protein